MPQEVDDDEAARRRRALFRAHHRGTREMDFLLGIYADTCVPGMSEEELELFEHLLTLPDPALMNGIVEAIGEFEAPVAELIGRVRAFHRDKS